MKLKEYVKRLDAEIMALNNSINVRVSREIYSDLSVVAARRDALVTISKELQKLEEVTE